MRPHADRQNSIAALARQAITAHTEHDSLILDPICGTGDILVEAVRAGRMAIGVEHEPYWVDMARTRIERTTDTGRGGFAAVVNGSVNTLVRLLADEAQRHQASMVLTAPQAGTTVRANHSGAASNLAEFIEGSVSAVAHCARLTTPQGVYGIVCWPTRHSDVPRSFEEAFATTGFEMVDRQTVVGTPVSLLLFRRADMDGPV